MYRNLSLRIRIITLLMVFIPIAVISYYIIFENAVQRKAAEIDKNIMIAKSNAMYIERDIFLREKIITNLANLTAFKTLDQQHMRQLLALHQHIPGEEYLVTDARGNVLTLSPDQSNSTRQNLQSCVYFQQALQGKFAISGMHQSVLTGKYFIALYTPIVNDSGKIVGTISVRLSPNFFQAYLAPTKIGKTGKISLIDAKGFYISDSTIDTSKNLVVSKCYYDGLGKEVNVSERTSNRTGERTIFVKVRLKTLGWYVVAYQPSSEVSTPAMLAVRKNVLTMTLLVITLLALWYYRVSLADRERLLERQNSEKLALVGELAAGMAHEIRNPLTTIKGFSQLLRGRQKYQNDVDILDLLCQSVDHIEGIVQETLLLAKPQKMALKVIELNSLIEETANFMRNEATLRDLTLTFYRSEVPIHVNVDVVSIKQVLINLIKNALEASSPGGAIEIGIQPGEENVTITVKDYGCGINPNLMNKIGTPFFTTKPAGTGLGLSVCRRIIEEHHGLLQIDSKPGEGTTVEITLQRNPILNS